MRAWQPGQLGVASWEWRARAGLGPILPWLQVPARIAEPNHIISWCRASRKKMSLPYPKSTLTTTNTVDNMEHRTRSNDQSATAAAARNRTHTPETKSEISDGAAVGVWVLVILLFFQQFALAVVAFTVLIFWLSSGKAFVHMSHGDTSVVLALATSQTQTSFDIHTLRQPRSLMLADGHASLMLADGPAGE